MADPCGHCRRGGSGTAWLAFWIGRFWTRPGMAIPTVGTIMICTADCSRYSVTPKSRPPRRATPEEQTAVHALNLNIVMHKVSAYGSHQFATAVSGVAPNLFAFLMRPRTQPPNNPAERDIRDTAVVQRKIRCRFMNFRMMRVFMIQISNSTCREHGLVPWKFMARMVDDLAYNIFRAGDDTMRVSPPRNGAEPATHGLYVDGVAIDIRASDLDGDSAAALAAKIAAEGGLEPDYGPPPTTDSVYIGRSPSVQSRAQCVAAYEHTAALDVSDSLLRHGKPPPWGWLKQTADLVDWTARS